MIQVYLPGNTAFDQNGDMILLPVKAAVSAALNGEWTLDMEHPIDSEGRWKSIADQAVIKAPSFNGDQLFRVLSKTVSDEEVRVLAEPIFMDARNDCWLADIRPTEKNGQDALDLMTAPNTKYRAISDIAKKATAYYEDKNLIEALCGDDDNAFIRRWGGEILFDNFTVTVNERIGGDYGVQLLYGKNLIKNGVEEDVDFSDVCTRLYPKAYNGRALSGKGYVDSPLLESYPTVKARAIQYEDIKMIEDAQEDDEENGVTVCSTREELDAALRKKCEDEFAGGLDKPKVTVTAEMAPPENIGEYQAYKDLERVSLGDTVHLKHHRLGIVSDARVVSLTYDCVRRKVSSVVIGDFEESYFNRVSSVVDRVQGAVRPDGSLVAERVSGFISGAMASLRAQYDVAEKQDVLAILFENLDESSPLYGALGIGTQGVMISKERTADGRGWNWTTALTSGGLIADVVVTGLLSDKAGSNYWNLDTGEFRLSAASTVGGKTLEETVEESIGSFVEDTFTPQMEEIQKSLDGQMETYYYDYEPAEDNIPAAEWTSEEQKSAHTGDLFYWKSKGYAYRWTEDGGAYSWVRVQDSGITDALSAASRAQDTADNKRRVFTVTPVPPYDAGDLWVQGEHGDIMRCQTPKAQGEAYAENDWVLASKYTDNTALSDFMNGDYQNTLDELSRQNDRKAETWYQESDPSAEWTDEAARTLHKGDLWYDTARQTTQMWNGVQWEEMTSNPPREVFDAIDGKAQIFVSQPAPPYAVGDLWFDKDNPSDIMTCVTSRKTGSFQPGDWKKCDKYIDRDTADESAENAWGSKTQEDVFNKLTNNGKNCGIYLTEDGGLYINASYLKSGEIDADIVKVKNLIAERLRSTDGAKTMSIDSSVLQLSDDGYSRVRLTGDTEGNVNGKETTLGKLQLWRGDVRDGDLLNADSDARLSGLDTSRLVVGEAGANGNTANLGKYEGFIYCGTLTADHSVHTKGGLTVDGDVKAKQGKIFLRDNTWISKTSSGDGCGLYSSDKDVYIQAGSHSVQVTQEHINLWGDVYLNNATLLHQSDARLKEHIAKPDIRALPLINAIQTRQYDWLDSGKHEDVGLIAQQLQTVLPSLVTENRETGALSVNEAGLIPYLLKAIQELYGMVCAREPANAADWQDPYTEEDKQAMSERVSKRKPSMPEK